MVRVIPLEEPGEKVTLQIDDKDIFGHIVPYIRTLPAIFQ